MYKPKQTKMSKYYKSKIFPYTVRKIKGVNGSSFMGVVVMGEGIYKKGGKAFCNLRAFTPYTPTPQELIDWGETTTLTNDNQVKVEVDDKDAALRLECLKLAVELNKAVGIGAETCIIEAAQLYDYVTGKTSMNYEIE